VLSMAPPKRVTFLFESEKPAPYACLSYCCGPDVDDVLKSKRCSLQSHYYAVQFSLLAPTIRDAVILSNSG
jgi:hypothetical protein